MIVSKTDMEQLVSQYIQFPEWNQKKAWIQNNFLKR